MNRLEKTQKLNQGQDKYDKKKFDKKRKKLRDRKNKEKKCSWKIL